MKKSFSVGQKEFDALLDLLSENREEAGEKYERLRAGLLRYFRYKGCFEPSELVDETFDRVARRADTFDPDLSEHPERFFYGFASRIALEYRRGLARLVPLDGSEPANNSIVEERINDSDLEHLERCLGALETADFELITEYHSLDGQARIELRQKMCVRLNATPTAVYARVSRIRTKLKRCIEGHRKNNV